MAMVKRGGLQNAAKKITIIFLFLSLGLVSVIGLLQPPMSDDFGIINKVNETQQSFLAFLHHWYFNWTGRVQGIVLAWLAFYSLSSRTIFMATNGLALAGVIFFSFFLGRGRWPRTQDGDLLALSALLAAIWFLMPGLNQMVFWTTGAAWYLWSAFFGLLFLLPYRKVWDRLMSGSAETCSCSAAGRWARNVLAFLGGIWIGASMEQMLVAVGFLLFAFYACLYREKRLSLSPHWVFWGGAGLLIGGLLLVIAPGNYVRLTYHGAMSSRERLLLFANWFSRLQLIALVFALVLWRGIQNRLEGTKRAPATCLVFMLAALVSNLPLLFIPAFLSERTEWFPLFFAIIAFVALFASERDLISVLAKNSTMIVLVMSVLCYLASTPRLSPPPALVLGLTITGLLVAFPPRKGFLRLFSFAGSHKGVIAFLLAGLVLYDVATGLAVIGKASQEAKRRDTYIVEQIRLGNRDIVVPPFRTRQGRTFHKNDISRDKDNWINVEVAKWYKISSVRLTD